MASESPGNTSPMNLSHIGHRAFGSNLTGNCTGDRKSGECGESILLLTSSRPLSTFTTSTFGRSHSMGASTSMYFTAPAALWLVHFEAILGRASRTLPVRCIGVLVRREKPRTTSLFIMRTKRKKKKKEKK